MLNNRPQYEPVAWWYTRKTIGRGLRECYQPPDELSPRLRALLAELGEQADREERADKARMAEHLAVLGLKRREADIL
jgi:hypothetical protein